MVINLNGNNLTEQGSALAPEAFLSTFPGDADEINMNAEFLEQALNAVNVAHDLHEGIEGVLQGDLEQIFTSGLDLAEEFLEQFNQEQSSEQELDPEASKVDQAFLM